MPTSTPETLLFLLLTVLFLFWLVELARIDQPAAPRKASRPAPIAIAYGRRLSSMSTHRERASTRSEPGCNPLRTAQEISTSAPRKVHQYCGLCLLHPDCRYFNNHDPQVYPATLRFGDYRALLGYGHHGRRDPIQDFYCQACHHNFTARRHIALYRLKTLPATIAQVLQAVAEGLSLQATARVFHLPDATAQRWLTRAGLHSHALHDQLLRGLHLTHVQLDELRLKLRGAAEAAWLWVACDARTKLIPAFALGPRTQTLANQLVHELVCRLAPGELPIFSSDGLALYFYSLTAHFGHWEQAAGEHRRR